MKIWITKEEMSVNVFHEKPLYDAYCWYRKFKYGGMELCNDGERALKAILRLDDWPKQDEVLEYDTVKEEGWIYHGKYL